MMPCCSSSFHFLTEQAYKMFLRLGCILIVVVLSHFSQTKSKGLSNERITTLSEKKSRQSAKNMFEQRKNRQNKHDKKKQKNIQQDKKSQNRIYNCRALKNKYMILSKKYRILLKKYRAIFKKKILNQVFQTKALEQNNLKNTIKLKPLRKTNRQQSKIIGDVCQFVEFARARSLEGSGCSDGTKVVISKR